MFDYEKIEKGFCSYVLLKLSKNQYGNPEKVGKTLSSHKEVESVDVITGDFELIVKVRVKDQHEYYNYIKRIASLNGVDKTFSLVSFKQIKSEFVTL